MATHCRICSSSNVGEPFLVREMMFGLREGFEYIECLSCGCIQILKYPADLSRFYPPDYYSFNSNVPKPKSSLISRIILYLKYFARLYYRKFNRSYRAPWPIKLGMYPHHRVLDIGCGNGARLMEWYNLGAFRLTGIDQFVSEGRTLAPGVRIIKGDFYDLEERYDLVMMHETLEHLPNQQRVFDKVNALLNKGGTFLVRIPIKSWAWETYGVNWVQLDAPRHFYIHTENSLNLLAQNAGFRVEEVLYDSWHFQFTGSELYVRDISLMEARQRSIFSEEEIDEYRKRAKQLNKERKGDQAAFILKKKVPK